MHADFNRNEKLRLDRRLNVLIYLNRDWQESFGGALELWDREMAHAVAKVLPVFNRCVVFATTDHSFHGHPEPLTCPPDRTRRSIALYYYTSSDTDQAAAASHSTLYQERPRGAPPAHPKGDRAARATRADRRGQAGQAAALSPIASRHVGSQASKE